MPDQLLKLFCSDFPATLELHRGKRRKLFLGQSQQLELGTTTLDLHSLLTRTGHPNGGIGQLFHDLAELASRECQRAFLIDRCRNDSTDSDVQVSCRKSEAILRCLDQDIGEHGKRGLCRHAGSDRGETLVQFVPGDRELHCESSMQHQ